MYGLWLERIEGERECRPDVAEGRTSEVVVMSMFSA